MRALFLLVLAAPLTAQAPVVTPFQEAKVRSLFRVQLPCLGCHELEGDGGRNAPSLTTVAARRNAAYIRAIIEDPQRIVPGAAMPRTPMPQATREAVIRYLTRNASGGAPPPTRTLAVYGRNLPPSGLYNRWCASCHGHSGSADGPDAKYLPVPPAVHHDAVRMGARSDDALFDVIAGGGAVMGKSARMPAFGSTLTPTEIRSLVGHIRNLCACVGPGWSRSGSGR